MARANKDFAALLKGSLSNMDVEKASVPDLAGQRDTAMIKMARGTVVNSRVELVDPSRCKPWAHADRDIDLLNEETCADLIETFKAAGRQQQPALVRRITGDPDHDFEIIYGLRRHWTAQWMQKHVDPDFKFLVTVKALNDTEAFIASDHENRARKDLSDLERARKYAKSLATFFGGDQRSMAQSLGIHESWLSRLLSLAAMPADVIDAFGHAFELKGAYAVTLNPLLNNPVTRPHLMAIAREIADEQNARKSRGEPLLKGPEVLKRLKTATERSRPPKQRRAKTQPFVTDAGQKFLEAERVRGGGLRVQVFPKAGASREEIIAAFAKLLDEMGAK